VRYELLVGCSVGRSWVPLCLFLRGTGYCVIHQFVTRVGAPLTPIFVNFSPSHAGEKYFIYFSSCVCAWGVLGFWGFKGHPALQHLDMQCYNWCPLHGKQGAPDLGMTVCLRLLVLQGALGKIKRCDELSYGSLEKNLTMR
jgi:hypothetical protein